MRQAPRLTRPASIFPWTTTGTTTGTATGDLDHTVAYLPREAGGPPGQTRLDNLGPMTRFAHRVKTHAPGWRHHQPTPVSTYGDPARLLGARVDQHGSHPSAATPTPANSTPPADVSPDANDPAPLPKTAAPGLTSSSPFEAAFARLITNG